MAKGSACKRGLPAGGLFSLATLSFDVRGQANAATKPILGERPIQGFFNTIGGILPLRSPGRDDYRLDDNPFVQVRDYVKKLRKAGVARASTGKEIRVIEENTPFLGYIIADITPTMRSMMDQFGPFYRKAGHGSYYKWDEGFKVFIEVSSYAEVLRNAKARHEAFFQKLGISP